MKEEYVLNKITKLLDDRGWKLYRLAKESDISYSTLRNSYQRSNVPSVPTLIRICDGLGITMSEFFDESESLPAQLTASDLQLLAYFHSLKRNDKRLVIAYIKGLLKIEEAENQKIVTDENISS